MIHLWSVRCHQLGLLVYYFAFSSKLASSGMDIMWWYFSVGQVLHMSDQQVASCIWCVGILGGYYKQCSQSQCVCVLLPLQWVLHSKHVVIF